MSNSPNTYLKRRKSLKHVQATADRYQAGQHHTHDYPIDDQPEREHGQSAWGSQTPDKKGLEEAVEKPL